MKTKKIAIMGLICVFLSGCAHKHESQNSPNSESFHVTISPQSNLKVGDKVNVFKRKCATQGKLKHKQAGDLACLNTQIGQATVTAFDSNQTALVTPLNTFKAEPDMYAEKSESK